MRTGRRRLARAALGVGAAAALGLPHGSPPVAADENYSPPTWNGKKIYLSPARHANAGGRGECLWANENEMAYAVADGLTHQPYGLLDRQYKVQIGTTTYQNAVANSNSWVADIHLVLHSNAIPNATGTCASRTGGNRGTNVIYHQNSSAGADLSQRTVDQVGPFSPGTNDYKCKQTDGCTRYDSLFELSATNATAAYSETEFHDWGAGVQFLRRTNWQTRFGEAIDGHLGYPRG